VANQTNNESRGKWQQSESVSPIDDSKTVVLRLEAENKIDGWLGKTVRPALLIRCKEKKTELYVSTDLATNPERGDAATVRLRIDSRPAVTQQWKESTSNDALFAPRPIQLARDLAAAETWLFEFTPFNSNPALVRFDVRDLKAHLDAVSTACDWKEAGSTPTIPPRISQQLRDSGYVLAAEPFELNGVPIPIPVGAEPRPSDAPNTATFFVVTLKTIGVFYQAAMQLQGWTPIAGDMPCWSKNVDGKTRKVCGDFTRENRISLTLEAAR